MTPYGALPRVIVCHCHSVTDTTILDVIAEGARDVAQVGASCRAGTGCGGCRGTIEHLLDAAAAVEEVFVTETTVETLVETLVALPVARLQPMREASYG